MGLTERVSPPREVTSTDPWHNPTKLWTNKVKECTFDHIHYSQDGVRSQYTQYGNVPLEGGACMGAVCWCWVAGGAEGLYHTGADEDTWGISAHQVLDSLVIRGTLKAGKIAAS